MIQRNDGKIAIKWVLNRPAKLTKIDGTDRVYSFIPKFNVWMEWVEPDDVSRLLSFKEKTCNCNNGTYKNAFAYANLLDVNLWMTGDRHGNGVERTWREVSNAS